MSYPEQIDRFDEKLNRKTDGGTYVIEEEIWPVDGVYEQPLKHDHVIADTVQVYTGPGFTGTKITNFLLSVLSETPWKKSIKIFSEAPKVYVTYETPGDQVEADDMNRLQESVTAVQEEIERYKEVTDHTLDSLDHRLTAAETNKAEKTYVDAQLLMKADKAVTYTKTETDQRIQAVIGAAPDALDTLQELANALNNDPDFAATMTTQLAGKVDKVAGKQLSTEDFSTAEKAKLAGVAAGAGTANSATDAVIGQRTISDAAAPAGDSATVTALFGWLAYMIKAITGKASWRTAPAMTLEAAKAHVDATTGIHGSTSAAAAHRLILRDADGRAQVAPPAAAGDIARKDTVDAVQAHLTGHIGAGGAVHAVATASEAGFMSAADKAKLNGIAAGANNYTHPATHPASIIVQDANNRFVSDAEKTSWNAKETPAGAQSKADAAAASANVYTDSHAGRTDNPHAVTKAQVGLGNVQNYGVASQAAAEAGTANTAYMTPLRTAQAIDVKLALAGYGDMLKSVYDTNNNGKVDAADAADSVPWSGVTGKPAAFAPSAHTHAAADIASGTIAAARLPSATTSAAGIVQLNNAVNSTSTTQAATANAVKTAYDAAQSKLGPGVTWNQLKGV